MTAEAVTSELWLTGESTPPGRLLRELWAARRLAVVLARNEYLARYRSSLLGLLWSLLVPLLQTVVLAIVFTHVVRVAAPGQSYALYVLSGTAVWSTFSSGISSGSTAIVDTGAIAGRVYFPRLILPMLAPMAALVTGALTLVVAVLLLPAFPHSSYHVQLLALPLVVLLNFLFTSAFASVVALAHVYARDVRYLITASMLVWMYATPIIYPLHLAHGLRPYIEANPVTGIVQLSHWCFLGQADGLEPSLLATGAWLVGLLTIAVLAYSRYDRVACDRL
ncbi:MAG TPA: ABC transporter permease [Mycobacteriales bacterium]|nr:ABC transporter permease [Mycobacteriales bacterium]